MPNTFLNLPFPVSRGPGGAVDTSGMGADRTLVVGGSLEGGITVSVEVSVDGVGFQPIHTFFNTGEKTVKVSAPFMRVNVVGRGSTPVPASCDVGANNNGSMSVVLPLPAGDGAGAAVDVSDLGTFTTVVAYGEFPGATIAIEVSEDGVDYAPAIRSFGDIGGARSSNTVANFMRTFVRNRGSLFTAAVGASSAIDANPSVGAVLTFGNRSIAGAAGTRYISPGYTAQTATTSSDAGFRAPRGGTLSNFRVRHNMAAGNGNDVVYDVIIDGVPQLLNLALATGAIGDASDTVTEIDVAEGALIEVTANKAAGIGSGNQRVMFVCDFE